MQVKATVTVAKIVPGARNRMDDGVMTSDDAATTP